MSNKVKTLFESSDGMETELKSENTLIKSKLNEILSEMGKKNYLKY